MGLFDNMPCGLGKLGGEQGAWHRWPLEMFNQNGG